MEFVIITGMSGAGKSSAASIMEDMGFFCVDNMPAPLIPKFAELGMAGQDEYKRVVLVSDVRSGTNFETFFKALHDLEKMRCPYRILFIDASDESIIKRYKETRRNHPLAEECDTLAEAIALERKMLAPLRSRAEHIIDTTNLTLGKLRGDLRSLFSRNSGTAGDMDVRIVSFGYKYGLPMEADLVLDVRFLPNPYYVTKLRNLTGLDRGVKDYIFASKQTEEFIEKTGELIGWLLPRYVEEGMTGLVLAVGCTGGRHRSVAVAHALAERVRTLGYPVTESHRDMGR